MKRLALMIASLILSSGAFPCSIFKYSIDGKTYFCGNEDWTATDAAVQTYRPYGGSYSYILLGWKSYLPRYAQAGLNSEGLCFDWAVVPPQRYTRDGKKRDVGVDFVIDMLKSCRSISEAADFIQRYNVPHLAEEHIMLTDRTGGSCVIEYNNGRLQILKDAAHAQFITNFHLSDRSLGWYPCARFSKLEAFFNEKGNKENRLVEILDSVHQEGQYPTIYSYIFDLKSMKVSLFYNHDYTAERSFSFKTLVEKNATIDLSTE